MSVTQLAETKTHTTGNAAKERSAALPERRLGDSVPIPGDYQFRALHEGPAVQRFWHDTKLWLVREYLQPQPPGPSQARRRGP